MAQMLVWFVAGVAYIFIGIFNCRSARRLCRIDFSSPARYWIKYPEERRKEIEREEIEKIREAKKHFDEREMSREAYKIEETSSNIAINEIRIMRSDQNLNTAFDELDTFANEFNSATKSNRCVLYVAAASFFFAAAISFAQGLSLV